MKILVNDINILIGKIEPMRHRIKSLEMLSRQFLAEGDVENAELHTKMAQDIMKEKVELEIERDKLLEFHEKAVADLKVKQEKEQAEAAGQDDQEAADGEVQKSDEKKVA